MSDEREQSSESAEPKPARRGDIRLRAVSGVVIDHTLPLHQAVDDQWRKGELSRVDDNGMPWQGDEYDLSGAWDRRGRETWEAAGDPQDRSGEDSDAGEEDGEGDPEPGPPVPAGEPVRPADSAPRKAWQEYAVAITACTADEADAMTRDGLVKLCTPPEALPPAAGE